MRDRALPVRLSRLTILFVGVALGLALVGTDPASASSGFGDVEDEVEGAAIDALADAEIIQGCEPERFCPREPLSRAQMATILAGALDLPDVGASGFTDIAGNVHRDGIDRLAGAGITSGCTTSEFCPEELITRGQLASLLAHGFDPPPTDEVFFDDGGDVHASAIDRLAARGVVTSCPDSLVTFCPHEPVLRGQAALFVARATGLVDPVALAPLEERRAQQDATAEEDVAAAEEPAEDGYDPIWDPLADCESGDRIDGEVVPGTARWHTGATDPELDERPSWSSGLYDGGLQFHPDTWTAYRDDDMPLVAGDATREQQIVVGERVQASQGWEAWPHCSDYLGYL